MDPCVDIRREEDMLADMGRRVANDDPDDGRAGNTKSGLGSSSMGWYGCASAPS